MDGGHYSIYMKHRLRRYQWLPRAEAYDALVRLARAQAFENERQEAEAFRPPL